MAYPKEEDLRTKFRSEWKGKQDRVRKSRSIRAGLQLFVPKVGQWLVSKRYFSQTAKARRTAQDFTSAHRQSHLYFRSISTQMLVNSIGLFFEHGQRATLESRSRPDASSFLFR